MRKRKDEKSWKRERKKSEEHGITGTNKKNMMLFKNREKRKETEKKEQNIASCFSQKSGEHNGNKEQKSTRCFSKIEKKRKKKKKKKKKNKKEWKREKEDFTS